MLTVEEIKNRLKDRNLSAVARNMQGVSYGTVYRVATGRTLNPSYETVKALSDYLEGENGKKESA